jgi:hypothetical protein
MAEDVVAVFAESIGVAVHDDQSAGERAFST